MAFKHIIRTRYSETAQDKIIHHSSYVVYFEVARVEFFKELGCDINMMEKKGIFCPVVDLSVKYKKPLHSLEDIVIEVTVENLSKVRFSLNYHILREGVSIALGST